MTKPMVFISYSHKDEEWKDRLVTHLGVLQQEDYLDLWDDRRIGAGEDWYQGIQKAMSVVSVAILLVSANFLTSKFIKSKEIPCLLERRKEEGLFIYPVIIRPCAWKQVKWLAQMNLRPKDARAISGGNDHQIDADLAEIAEEIAVIISQEFKQSNKRISSEGFEVTSKARPHIYNKAILHTVYDEMNLPPIGSSEIPFYIWDVQNFDGFFYDIDDDLGKESLKLLQINLGAKERTIGIDKLVYSTTAEPKKLKVVSNGLAMNASSWDSTTAANKGLEQCGSGEAFDNGNYYIIGWRAEKYIALNGKVNKLAKLIIEQGSSAADKKILTLGETWEVGGGWALTVNSIDAKASPRQVWLTLSKDGVKKDDKVITSGGSNDKPIYTYVEKSLAGENDVPVFVTYIDRVFTSATTYMVQFRYTWAIGLSVTHIKSGDTYGVFTDVIVLGKTLILKNTDTKITLTPNAIIDLMGNLKFKVADSVDVLRFHPIIIKSPFDS